MNDETVGYLITRKRSLTLECWRCSRVTVVTPEQIEAGASRGHDEEIAAFVIRCRCVECGAKSPRYGYRGEPRTMLHGIENTHRGTLAAIP